MYVIQDDMMGAVDLYTPDNVGGGAYSLLGASAGKMGRFSYPGMVAQGVDPVFGGATFTFAQVAALAAQAISSITISGNVATLTTGSAHGLSVGSVINIAGAVPVGYNGLFTVASVPSTTTLTFNLSTFTDPRWNPNNPLVVNQANPAIPTGNATTVGTYVPGIGAGQVVEFTSVKDSLGNLITQAKLWAGTAIAGKSLGVSLANVLASTATSNPANPFGGQFAWFQIGGAAVALSTGAPAIGNSVYWSAGGGSGVGGGVDPTAVAGKQVLGMQYASALAASFGSGSSGLITLPANMAVIWGSLAIGQGAIT